MKMDSTSRMHRYQCDGMPTQMGCSSEIEISRPWNRMGLKKSGWLVCPDLEERDGKWVNGDLKLHFCPPCAQHVITVSIEEGSPVKQ